MLSAESLRSVRASAIRRWWRCAPKVRPVAALSSCVSLQSERATLSRRAAKAEPRIREVTIDLRQRPCHSRIRARRRLPPPRRLRQSRGAHDQTGQSMRRRKPFAHLIVRQRVTRELGHDAPIEYRDESTEQPRQQMAGQLLLPDGQVRRQRGNEIEQRVAADRPVAHATIGGSTTLDPGIEGVRRHRQRTRCREHRQPAKTTLPRRSHGRRWLGRRFSVQIAAGGERERGRFSCSCSVRRAACSVLRAPFGVLLPLNDERRTTNGERENAERRTQNAERMCERVTQASLSLRPTVARGAPSRSFL